MGGQITATAKILRKKSVKGLISKIEKEIRFHEKKINELQKLKDTLIKSNPGSSAKIKKSDNLSISDTKRLALDAYKKYGALTIPELKSKVEQDTNLNIKVSDARRAVSELDKECKIKQRKTGAWEIVD